MLTDDQGDLMLNKNLFRYTDLDHRYEHSELTSFFAENPASLDRVIAGHISIDDALKIDVLDERQERLCNSILSM